MDRFQRLTYCGVVDATWNWEWRYYEDFKSYLLHQELYGVWVKCLNLLASYRVGVCLNTYLAHAVGVECDRSFGDG